MLLSGVWRSIGARQRVYRRSEVMGNPAQDRDTGEPIPLFDHADVLHGYADLAGQRRALTEMAQLVPVLPRETSEWCGVPEDLIRRTSLRKLVRLNRDWRTEATVFDLIARNEHLRSLAA